MSGGGELGISVPASRESGYRMLVSPGALERLGEACADEVGAPRYAVVADARVAELYGDRALAALRGAGASAELFTFPPREESKSRGEWERLTDALLEAGYGRDAAVVALGGGVTGDLAGFVAATYMRGLPVVQVPTTLLAMLDSSVGGKTGVDTRRGKNLVGAFHQPALVVADPRLLASLARRELASGLAEGVKAAAIRDAALFEWMAGRADALLGGDPEALTELVLRGVRIKAAVVEEDPREAGVRAILNFGHTVGHALERDTGYELPHGAAVAAGMRVEARLGEGMGITETGTARRIAGLLDACGHAERPEASADPESLLAGIRVDKKGREGRPRCVLLRRVGEVARAEDGSWTHPLPSGSGERWLRAALREGEREADSRPG